MQAINWIRENYEHVLAIMGACYVLALAIVKLTPTPRDDEALEQVSVILRAIAALFGLSLKQGVEKKPEEEKAKPPSFPPAALLLFGLLLLPACGVSGATVKDLEGARDEWLEVSADPVASAEARQVGLAAHDWCWAVLYDLGEVDEIPPDVRARLEAHRAKRAAR